MRSGDTTVVERFMGMASIGGSSSPRSIWNIGSQIVDTRSKNTAAGVFPSLQRIAEHRDGKIAHFIGFIDVISIFGRAVAQHETQILHPGKVVLQRVQQLRHRDLFLLKDQLFHGHQGVANRDGRNCQRGNEIVFCTTVFKAHTCLDAVLHRH